MAFPQYRKYTNSSSYFKIISEREFEEIQVVGGKAIRHHLIAEQFPEIQRVADLLKKQDDRWVEISAAEYESVLKEFSVQGSS